MLGDVVHEVMARGAVLVPAADGGQNVRIGRVVAGPARRVQRREVRVRGRVARGADARVGPGHVVDRDVVDVGVARRAGLVARADGRDDRRGGGAVALRAGVVDRGQVRVAGRVALGARVRADHFVLRHVVHEVMARRAVLVASGDGRDDVAIAGTVTGRATRMQRREVGVAGGVAGRAHAGVGAGNVVQRDVVGELVARRAVLVTRRDGRDDVGVTGTVTRCAAGMQGREVGVRGRVARGAHAAVRADDLVLCHMVHEVVASGAALVPRTDRRDDVRISRVVADDARRVQRREVRDGGRVARGSDTRVGPGHVVDRDVVHVGVARRAGLVVRSYGRDDVSVGGVMALRAAVVDRRQVRGRRHVALCARVRANDVVQRDVVDVRVTRGAVLVAREDRGDDRRDDGCVARGTRPAVDGRQVRALVARGALIGAGHVVQRHVVHEIVTCRAVRVAAIDGRYDVRISGSVTDHAVGMQRDEVLVAHRMA